MKQQLEQRLQSLKSEFESGQKMLADLEAKQVNLRETLLRISGAIQVLEEELNNASEVADDNNQSPETANAEVITNAGDAS